MISITKVVGNSLNKKDKNIDFIGIMNNLYLISIILKKLK